MFGHAATAFDATWALGQALNYTEQMRMQIMTVNGALNDNNWKEKIFHEKCNMIEKNASLVEGEVCGCCNMSYLINLSTEDIINRANCSKDRVVQTIQDCMVEELANYTDCTGMDGALVPLNEFNYSNAFMGCVIRYNLQQTDFVGILVSSIFCNEVFVVYYIIVIKQSTFQNNETMNVHFTYKAIDMA